MDTLLVLLFSFIYPHMNHCVHLWGSTDVSYKTKHFFWRKKTVWIIHGVDRRAHSGQLFSSRCILSIGNEFAYIIGLVMYKYHHGLLPHMSHIFKNNPPIFISTTHGNQICCVFLVVVLNWESIFRYRALALTVWNVIFESVYVDIEISTFKRHIKS